MNFLHCCQNLVGMGSVFEILIQVGIRFLVSLVLGLASLKIYDLFLNAFQNRDRLKIWWAFTSSIFLFIMVLFLFTK